MRKEIDEDMDNQIIHDTEDKSWWVLHGRKKEDTFVDIVAPRIGLDAVINPKKQNNPYAPDLIVNGKISDLKCQNTPFFKAGILYGIHPRFAVTFNYKDFQNYSNNYPNIDIYFWVSWEITQITIRQDLFEIDPLSGVWKIDFKTIQDMISERKVPLHHYQRRRSDNLGNAKDSYIFDLRNFEAIWIKEN